MTHDWGTALTDLVGPLQLTGLGLIMARTLAMLTFSPVLGGSVVRGPVRMGLAAAIGLLMLPIMAETVPSPAWGPGFLFQVASEVGMGFLIGFLASLLFQAYSLAGRLIDTQRGANTAETLDFLVRDQTSFLGQFLSQCGIVAVLLAGGHLLLLAVLAESFRLVPPGSFLVLRADSAILESVARLSGDVFKLGLLLAAPSLVLLCLVDVASGLVSRAAPQMNTYQTMQPARLLIGLWGLTITLPVLMSMAPGEWEQGMKATLELLRRLHP